MGFKDILQKLTGKGSRNREAISNMAEQIRMERIANERQLSSNERELNRYRDEDREEAIKEHLEYARRKRDQDIKFGHNPLDTKNIMKSEWEVLKEKNQFAGKSNMLRGENTVMKNNPNLLKSNNRLLKSNDKVVKGGNMFKI